MPGGLLSGPITMQCDFCIMGASLPSSDLSSVVCWLRHGNCAVVRDSLGNKVCWVTIKQAKTQSSNPPSLLTTSQSHSFPASHHQNRTKASQSSIFQYSIIPLSCLRHRTTTPTGPQDLQVQQEAVIKRTLAETISNRAIPRSTCLSTCLVLFAPTVK